MGAAASCAGAGVGGVSGVTSGAVSGEMSVEVQVLLGVVGSDTTGAFLVDTGWPCLWFTGPVRDVTWETR
ncbi:hypothetical protein KEM60_02511 [Austwickia sp. TVS 96-490-7B]|nr:hypothetical protein [Austwickia sp. TVS 96-490-7B]